MRALKIDILQCYKEINAMSLHLLEKDKKVKVLVSYVKYIKLDTKNCII